MTSRHSCANRRIERQEAWIERWEAQVLLMDYVKMSQVFNEMNQ